MADLVLVGKAIGAGQKIALTQASELEAVDYLVVKRGFRSAGHAVVWEYLGPRITVSPWSGQKGCTGG